MGSELNILYERKSRLERYLDVSWSLDDEQSLKAVDKKIKELEYEDLVNRNISNDEASFDLKVMTGSF